jgi:hypothetical protein
MHKNEIRLISDLLKHYKQDIDVDDALIKSYEEQYGGIRGIVMNLLYKFEPNVNVTDEYLDKKLSSYGIGPDSANANTTPIKEADEKPLPQSKKEESHSPKEASVTSAPEAMEEKSDDGQTKDEKPQVQEPPASQKEPIPTAPEKPEPPPGKEPSSQLETPVKAKEPRKKASKALIIIVLIIIVLGAAGGGLYWYALRTMENEKFITINAIKMRQYPDTDSEEIGKYSFKTRFRIIEEKSELDPKDRYWAKVEVMGSMGWLNGTTGWMVIREGTISWAMSETDCLLMDQLLGNDEAHERLGSKYRNSLLYYFKNNTKLLPHWKCYMQPPEEENQLAAYASFGISENDKDDNSQGSFICIIQNKEQSLRKLLVFSYNEQKEPSIVYESECNGCYALNVLPKGKKVTYGVSEKSFVPASDAVEAKHLTGRYLLYFENNQFALLDD